MVNGGVDGLVVAVTVTVVMTVIFMAENSIVDGGVSVGQVFFFVDVVSCFVFVYS